MEKEYHTLNEGIPVNSREENKSHIGIDTKQNRNGLHLWIGKHEINRENESTFVSQSVHLSREDAWNLIEEIKHRLF